MSYDLIVVGTGPAGAFFLEEALGRLPSSARVLVLERGPRRAPDAWSAGRGARALYGDTGTWRASGMEGKDWFVTIGFGGGSNCWYACAPRMLPEDFRTRTLHGVSADWPVSYEELEPWYTAVEERMAISGRAEPFLPRSRPFPQRPHRWSTTDALLAKASPGKWTVQPTARARDATAQRPACCATGVCYACPHGAKWMVSIDMVDVYADPRVELRIKVAATRVLAAGGRVFGVAWRAEDGTEGEARAPMVALAASGIFNPAILLASGITHGPVGEGLHEQLGVMVRVALKGVRGGDGSTHITGHGYPVYEGPWRRERGAMLIENYNSARDILRLEPGRELEAMLLKFIVEEERLPENRVVLDPDGIPRLHYVRHSARALAAVAAIPDLLPEILRGLPVEAVRIAPPEPTEAHVQGTCVMGLDPSSSVVDPFLEHHAVRGLFVLGASAFPTGAPANPTLTLSALAKRAAARALGGLT